MIGTEPAKFLIILKFALPLLTMLNYWNKLINKVGGTLFYLNIINWTLLRGVIRYG